MSRSVSLQLLDSIKIASPCSADWDAMTGDDRVRHCAECKLNVYNLSAMTADEAVALVQSAEGRLCVNLFKRADGTVITADCPVGLRAARIKAGKALARMAVAAALLITGGIAAATGRSASRVPSLGSMRPFSTIRAWFAPTVIPPLMGKVAPRSLRGALAIPRVPSQSTSGSKP